MKYLLLAASTFCLTACGAEGNASEGPQQDAAQIAGNSQPDHADVAPPGNPMLGQLAEMGGGVEAASELCTLDIDTVSAKQDQQANFVSMGGTQQQFEMAYKAGYDRAKAEFEAASAAGRERMCEEFSSLPSQMENSM